MDTSSTDETASTDEATRPTAGDLLQPVLADLADVVEQIRPEQFGDPTPCTEFDLATLRTHVLGWVDYFGHAFTDPDGEKPRPDPTAFEAPDDPAEAAAVVRTAAVRFAQAVDAGAAGRPMMVVRATMPGGMALRMVLWDYVVHGNDLARAAGLPWHPPAAAVDDALEFAPGLLTDDYRGPGKDFGAAVPVPDDAPALDRLLAFSGRDPNWKA